MIEPLDEWRPIKLFVTIEELYDIIRNAHVALKHKGRNVLMDHLNAKYKNVTKEAVTAFLEQCPTCATKKRVQRKGLTVKPMVFKQFNDRVRTDLIDMQTMADGEWKWILVVQDHLTKFVHLRPLKSKRAVEVAENVLDIFLVFGAPSVIQSDNGREFCNAVMESLKDLWSELKIVHGKSLLSTFADVSVF